MNGAPCLCTFKHGSATKTAQFYQPAANSSGEPFKVLLKALAAMFNFWPNVHLNYYCCYHRRIVIVKQFGVQVVLCIYTYLRRIDEVISCRGAEEKAQL